MSLPMSRNVFEQKAKEHAETREAVKSALVNEMLTRKRVEILEAVIGRNFWGRAKWLFLGR